MHRQQHHSSARNFHRGSHRVTVEPIIPTENTLISTSDKEEEVIRSSNKELDETVRIFDRVTNSKEHSDINWTIRTEVVPKDSKDSTHYREALLEVCPSIKQLVNQL